MLISMFAPCLGARSAQAGTRVRAVKLLAERAETMCNKKSPRADGLVAYLPAGSLDTRASFRPCAPLDTTMDARPFT
jgi:hypothetical protein